MHGERNAQHFSVRLRQSCEDLLIDANCERQTIVKYRKVFSKILQKRMRKGSGHGIV
jgi:hypothetical protein